MTHRRFAVPSVPAIARPVARLTLVLTALAWAAVPATAAARQFYVSASGNDAAAGTSASAPWRTVARVNRAGLAPGDVVSFQAGQRFPGTIVATRSGSPAAPITYGSYGAGKASLPNGVWMRSVTDLVFRDLIVDGAVRAFTSSPVGSGTSRVSFLRIATRNNQKGFDSVNSLDRYWTIRDCTVDRAFDSGMRFLAADVTVQGCRISNVGLAHATQSWPAHGVYGAGPRLRLSGNEIWSVADPLGQAVSTRFRDAVIEGNHIHDVRHAVGYFRDDAGLGTTTVRQNRFVNVQQWVLYIGPGNRAAGIGENFDVIGNTVVNGSRSPGAAFRWYSTGGRRFVFRDNRVRGFAAVLQSTSGVLASGNVLEL